MNTALDENLVVLGDGAVTCAHCATRLGAGAADEFLEEALWRERPSSEAPPSVVRAPPEHFVDRPVRLRQAFCPTCLTLLLTEVLPVDEPRYRMKRLDV